jgi:glycosyltransferase involved in cell wall biosynthesis
MISIIYLYTSVNGFVLSTLKALHETGGVKEIYLIYRAKEATDGNIFMVDEAPWLKLIQRHTISERGIFELLQSIRPQILYVAGWVDKDYLRAVSRYRALGGMTRVVCGIDDQWKGSLRQYIGRIYFRMFYRKLFDYMWVSGKPQYHYAQRFGYEYENIICNLLSADTSLFDIKSDNARRFVFVGRFTPVKGIDILIDAYNSLPDSVRVAWPLVLIGDGSLRDEIKKRASPQIIIKPYLQPVELRNELRHGGVACIPSYKEQWGVVIHELASLGYPMIISSVCGAATEFLINGYNGYIFKSADVNSLRNTLLKMASHTDSERSRFADRSQQLGKRITPEHAA